jgi:hypothetical protein
MPKNITDLARVTALVSYFQRLEIDNEGFKECDLKTAEDYKPECDGAIVSVDVDGKFRESFWVIHSSEADAMLLDRSTMDRMTDGENLWYIDLA